MKDKRDRTLYFNTIVNYISRAVYYVFSFLAVPLALNFVGKEKFGVYQTILTFLSWVALANLGVGNGLRNKISEFLAGGRSSEIKGIIGSAYYIAFIVAVILLIVGTLFFWLLFDPNWIFSNLTISDSEVTLTFYISFVFFSINLFFSLFTSIAFGIHKSYLTSIAQVAHFALYSLFLFLLIKLNFQPYLIYIAISYGLGTVLSQVIPYLKIRKDKNLWPPKFKDANIYIKELLGMSIGFFILQLSSILLFSSDNFIISKLLGPNEVAEYSIANKIFFTIISVFSILLIQVWNSTTDALAKKDFNWIKKTVVNLHKILFLVFVASIIIAILLNFIIKVWVGTSFDFTLTFRILFAVYVLIHCSNAIYVNILNGLGRLKVQTIAYTFAAILNFGLSYIFIVKLNQGVVGVLYSKTFCIAFTSFLCMYEYKRSIKILDV